MTHCHLLAVLKVTMHLLLKNWSCVRASEMAGVGRKGKRFNVKFSLAFTIESHLFPIPVPFFTAFVATSEFFYKVIRGRIFFSLCLK